MNTNGTQPQDNNSTPSNAPADFKEGNRSIAYLLLVLAIISWLLFDTWINKHTLPHFAGYDLVRLKTPAFHLMAYTVMGGALGGIVNGLRSAVTHYSAFNRRYIWKYIAAPWMGATLALIGYAILHSAVVIFGGQTTSSDTDNSPQMLANFGIGALAGYGSKDVFVWLDAQVSKLFAVPQSTPKLTGQPRPVAVSQIQSQKLEVGAVVPVPASDGTVAGTVVDQSPQPGMPIDRGSTVDLVVTADPSTTTNTDGEQPTEETPNNRP